MPKVDKLANKQRLSSSNISTTSLPQYSQWLLSYQFVSPVVMIELTSNMIAYYLYSYFNKCGDTLLQMGMTTRFKHTQWCACKQQVQYNYTTGRNARNLQKGWLEIKPRPGFQIGHQGCDLTPRVLTQVVKSKVKINVDLPPILFIQGVWQCDKSKC